jgi:hypothetical protein
MAVQLEHRLPAKEEPPQNQHHWHNWYAWNACPTQEDKLTQSIGPKTNSAEKITMLRKGVDFHYRA